MHARVTLHGALAAATATLCGCTAVPARSEPSAAAAESAAHASVPHSIAVYALSRGTGVPAASRDAFRVVRELLERARQERRVTNLVVERIGIEGETRLCAEFADARAAEAIGAQVRALLTGRELVNVVEEPCSR